MKMRALIVSAAIALSLASVAQARDFTSTITQSDQIQRLRPEFKIPDEPNQLFYVQRSPNANTVIYAAKLDAQGAFDRDEPVEAFWRKFNIDSGKKPLNFIERMMAYGAHADRTKPGQPITFTIAALPERRLTLTMDEHHRPEALIQIGNRTAKLAYVYLQVVEGGLTPSVPSLDILGTDTVSGKAVHEHLVQK